MLSISLALSVSFLAFCVSSALGEKDVKLYKRSAKKTGLSKSCQATDWSTWSSCMFCDFSSVSKRTRKDGKCSTITETRPCKTGECEHNCHEDSKTCSCHSGYDLINGKNCENINECRTKGGRGPCSQYCQDEPGSYKCFCKKGYRLKYSTKCELLDCGKPQFSNCPPVTQPTAEEDHLNICSKVNVSCLNGTKYNAECFLSCPKYYKLALKRRTIKWSDYSRFEFPNASSKIICHHLTPSIGKWHSRIDDYYCRRSNDPPMEIKLVGTSVKEKLPPGSVVGKLSTRDEQLDQDMIYSVRNSSYFRCNGSILVTMVTLLWEASQYNSYAVFIRVQDNGMPSMWREKKFLIYVENVNDVPRDIEISRNWVYENATRGATVGVLSAIDDDLGNYRTSNFSWKLLKDKTDSFNISGSNVIVGRKLNYDVAKLFYIKVSCSDGFSSTVQNIPIYVIERPTLTLTGSHIAENSERGTVVTMIKVESEGDRDMKVMITESTPNATHKLKLNPDPRCVRHIKIIKYKTTCYANITVSGQLDYEVANGYLLQIYVTDGVLSNFAKWNISVLNMNEKPTELEINGLQEIAENTIGGTDIGFLMISDPDNKNKITQTHFCRITNNGSDGKYFHIESPRNSLQIKKNKFLNYEAQQSYKIVIKCEDSGFPPLSITREFTINVTDMDEPIENLTLSNNRVLENSDVGAVIGILAAHDPDAHDDTSIAFAIIHPTYSPFFLRGKNNEILVVNGSLNYEENSDYVITIGVTDSQDRYFQAPFVIHIVDVPETPTDIIMDRHFMKENLETGSPISNITMIDEDSNTITTCILVKDGDGRIAVNRTYLVAGNVNTDYEEDATHMIEITVKCCDQDKLCLTKDFNISIRDVNEPPKDIIITSNLRVPEEKKNVTIGQITTVDADINPQYNCIVISSIKEALSIDSDNQTLRLKKKLNFEKNSFVLFEITCTNRDSMPYTKQFTLNVTDVNETPKSGCLKHIFVSNNHSNGSVLASLNVTDPDNEYPKDICKPKQRLTYREISESPLPFDIIDGYLVKTGELEKNRTYVLWISVYDDGVLLNSSSSLIMSERKEIKFNCTITCQDASDEMITLSSNEIKEGALNFTTVGYLYMGHTHALNTTFKLIKNKCDASPFYINTNQLRLRLPWKRKISFEDTQTVPKYFHIKIREKGSQREEMFIIFVKENKDKRYGICPTKVEIEISKTINRRFKLVAIQNINGSLEKCNNNSNNSRTLSYQCTTKLNLKN
ncbi:fat-like cadherin-related tumor suppressor homolog [Xenia sp. Carnegie-2017]|uniref:fat-like cadherin-related tumor suppressor homolog n=1 Tax=Xenia sp. Carnegie-2017 TaxID=2897299 RepID=UPI001F03CCA0|nr:fat-like cadherin-related tumor suppressor homolog [Xenia sp. Carnegie-2017]